jgi:hypothetical protein
VCCFKFARPTDDQKLKLIIAVGSYQYSTPVKATLLTQLTFWIGLLNCVGKGWDNPSLPSSLKLK